MEACKTGLRLDHSDTLLIIDNLTLIYQNQGWWLEAETLQVQAMETFKTKLGLDHPDAPTTMGNLALLYQKLDRWL